MKYVVSLGLPFFILTLLLSKAINAQNNYIFRGVNGLYGLKDNKGDTLSQAIYKNISFLNYLTSEICDCDYLEGICILDNGKKKAIFSITNKKRISDFAYDEIRLINTDDLGMVRIGGKIGIIRIKTGQIIIPIEMDSLLYDSGWVDEWGPIRKYQVGIKYHEKYLRLIKNKTCNLYDMQTGKLFFEGYHKDIVFIKEGSKILIANQSNIGPYVNGKAKVTLNQVEFYINELGYKIE